MGKSRRLHFVKCCFFYSANSAAYNHKIKPYYPEEAYMQKQGCLEYSSNCHVLPSKRLVWSRLLQIWMIPMSFSEALLANWRQLPVGGYPHSGDEWRHCEVHIAGWLANSAEIWCNKNKPRNILVANAFWNNKSNEIYFVKLRLNKLAHILQIMFADGFHIQFSVNVWSRGIMAVLFQVMAWCRTVGQLLSHTMMTQVGLFEINATRPDCATLIGIYMYAGIGGLVRH